MANSPKKTTRKSTRKTTTSSALRASKKAAAPSDAVPAPISAPDVAIEAEAVEAAPMLRKPDLIERAVARCEVKKRDAKPAIEAALAVLGEALSNGEELALPPLGRVKIARRVEKDNAEVIILRLRRPKNNANG